MEIVIPNEWNFRRFPNQNRMQLDPAENLESDTNAFAVFLKIGVALCCRFLSIAFLKLGLAGGLVMEIIFDVRTLLIGGEFQLYPLLMSSEGPNQGWTDLLGSSEIESAGTSSSVNQRGARPALAPNEVAPPVVPYPYLENEIIGGHSVESIKRRLLGRFFSPSAHDIQIAQIQAKDLFEVKVDILRVMAGLDPSGDWIRWNKGHEHWKIRVPPQGRSP
ncbi:hypothetical protein JHK87_055532 [Glycine soja]|nr:hypothetical protein JHK87_055532 [Glycine soja]